MKLELGSSATRFIQTRIRKYGSAEEVVQAGLAALRVNETFGDFAPGEMGRLLQEGERSIAKDGTVDAYEVFATLRRRSEQKRHRTRESKGKTKVV